MKGKIQFSLILLSTILLTNSIIKAHPVSEKESEFMVLDEAQVFPGFTILQNLDKEYRTIDEVSITPEVVESVQQSVVSQVPEALPEIRISEFVPVALEPVSVVADVKEVVPKVMLVEVVSDDSKKVLAVEPMGIFTEFPGMSIPQSLELTMEPTEKKFEMSLNEEVLLQQQQQQEQQQQIDSVRDDSSGISRPLTDAEKSESQASSAFDAVPAEVSIQEELTKPIEIVTEEVIGANPEVQVLDFENPITGEEERVFVLSQQPIDVINQKILSTKLDNGFFIDSPESGKVTISYDKPITQKLIKYLQNSLGNFKDVSDGELSEESLAAVNNIINDLNAVQLPAAVEEKVEEIIMNTDEIVGALINVEVQAIENQINQGAQNVEILVDNSVVETQKNQVIAPAVVEVPKPSKENSNTKPRPEYGIQGPKKPVTSQKGTTVIVAPDVATPAPPVPPRPFLANLLDPFHILPGWMIPSGRWPSFSRVFQRIFNKNRGNKGQTLILDEKSGLPSASSTLRLGIDVDCMEDRSQDKEEQIRSEAINVDMKDLCERNVEGLVMSESCGIFCEKNGFEAGACSNESGCVCQLGEENKFGLLFKKYESILRSEVLSGENGAKEDFGKCKNCPCSSDCQRSGAYIGYCGNSCYCGLPWHDGSLAF